MSIWDKIATLTPTRDAAVAVSGGDAYEAPRNTGRGHWKAPLATRPVPPGMQDLRGLRGGFLVVVGLLARQPTDTKNSRTRWLVRCVCGDYEVRRHETISRGIEPDDCCGECLHTTHLRARASKPSTRKTRVQAAERLDAMAAKSRGEAA